MFILDVKSNRLSTRTEQLIAINICDMLCRKPERVGAGRAAAGSYYLGYLPGMSVNKQGLQQHCTQTELTFLGFFGLEYPAGKLTITVY